MENKEYIYNERRGLMIEVRFHGRGGQGAVTSAEIIAQAAIKKGLYAQAFPSFGPERRGAPVQAFLRVSDKPIRLRSKVYKPDHVIILDSTLLGAVNPTDGLKKEGFVIINSNKSADELKKIFPGHNIAYVDASKIAREELGVPITNTTMLGSLIKATNVVDIEALEEPIRNRFGVVAQKNINAYMRAYKDTVIIKAG
jgi:pyruvate ferredoxin oxidoreductase gamma subunit